ncbi:MAG TPA: glycosyltransferase family 2 protein [Candidatus Limnocylindrales bacterium]|nr:glycosyltransferase family 2 protein [Candidatus Limnocylindrales bacterium]
MVVPVFDPGPYLERCIRSVVAQTLPASEFEAIFVDDGSTDGSGARLDALAAEHPNVRVVHQPNSGWPGKPRNVGIDAARGEYVFFLDHDDALGTDALERLYAFACRNRSDVVIGRVAGHGRGVPRWLFTQTRDRVTLWDSLIVDSLTPHKLFRRAFLDEHNLRFPEGRRRLEDHVFVLEAYFAASVISVLADVVCYHLYERGDAGNSSTDLADPAYYYRFVGEVIGVVEAHIEPGPRRDALLQRFARLELLGRLRRRRFLSHTSAYRAALFREIRSVVEEHIPPSVDALLSPFARTQMALVRADRLDLIVELARWEQSIVPFARVRPEDAAASDRIDPRDADRPARFLVDAGLVVQHGLLSRPTPLPLEERDGCLRLVVPSEIAAAVPAEARLVADTSLGRSSLVVRDPVDGTERVVSRGPERRVGRRGATLTFDDRVAVTLDPRTLGAPKASPASGSAERARPAVAPTHELILRFGFAGIARDLRVGHVGLGSDGRVVVVPEPHDRATRVAHETRRLGLALAVELSRHLDDRVRRRVWRLGTRIVRLLEP